MDNRSSTTEQILHALTKSVLSGERALREAEALYATDHWFDSRSFAKTALHVADRLREIGLAQTRIDEVPADNRTRYSGWTTAQAWDIDCGVLTIVRPQRRLLADWRAFPQHVIMRSESASGVFPVVAWNGADEVDLRGRIAFTHQRPAEVQHLIKAAGGQGLISDFLPELPGVRTREEALDHVLWEQVCFRPNPGGMWGFMISPEQGQWLETLLSRGPVTADVALEAHAYDGVTRTVDALLAADAPEGPELLLVAHLYEPGANDNASGAALALEAARTIYELQQAGKVRLKRPVRFLFALEGRGTMAWVHRHQADCRRLIAGLNLDEIGVDQSIGRSTAQVFLPPYSNPSFVGDLLAELAAQVLPPAVRWKTVADRADIILDTRFSDPSLGVPTPSIIQYPAWTYHTSKDTPEVLSPAILQAFGELAAVYLLRLATLSAADAECLDELLSRNARMEQLRLPSEDPLRLGLLRERLQAKQRELSRWGVTQLPRLSTAVAELPPPISATGPYARYVPRRTTLATPAGTQVAELFDGKQRIDFRKNLLDNGLDLVFHHFFYWADGVRSIEDICLRIEDELQHPSQSDSIPRTTTSVLTHKLGGALNRKAVLLMHHQLVEAGIIELDDRCRSQENSSVGEGDGHPG